MEEYTLMDDVAYSDDENFDQEYLRRIENRSRVARNLLPTFDELADIERLKNISTGQKSFATGIDMLLAAADYVERYGSILPTVQRCSHIDSLLRQNLLDRATVEMNGSTIPMQVPNAPGGYVSSNESPSSPLTPANPCPLILQAQMLSVANLVLVLRDSTPEDIQELIRAIH